VNSGNLERDSDANRTIGSRRQDGLHLTDNLLKTSYEVSYLEISERGRAAIARRDTNRIPVNEAVHNSDTIVLALPDNRAGSVTAELSDQFRPGAMLLTLDIAAPIAGVLPERDDLSIFVS
jgi:predicted dinucleotide-binding enzyme